MSAKTEFVETIICTTFSVVIGLIIAKCVDRYIEQQIQTHDAITSSETDQDQSMLQHDERLEAVVNRMFQRCIEDREYTQVFLPFSIFIYF